MTIKTWQPDKNIKNSKDIKIRTHDLGMMTFNNNGR